MKSYLVTVKALDGNNIEFHVKAYDIEHAAAHTLQLIDIGDVEEGEIICVLLDETE